jgi:hypothetical protein
MTTESDHPEGKKGSCLKRPNPVGFLLVLGWVAAIICVDVVLKLPLIVRVLLTLVLVGTTPALSDLFTTKGRYCGKDSQ